MNTLNLIGNICSILSLIIACYLAGQVFIIKNSIKVSSSNKVMQKKNRVIQGNLAGRDIKE